MKLKKKNNKPINKWKIAAIISMAINFLVAVLLAVGLAQPKTEKTSALSNGHYYVYSNRSDTLGSDFSYYSYKDLNWSSNYYSENEDVFYLVMNFYSEDYAFDYLDTSLYVNSIFCRFFKVTYYDSHGGRVIDYWLKYVNILPYGGQDTWRNVFNFNFDQSNGNILSNTKQSLGLDSPYIFLPIDRLGNTSTFFDALFVNNGTNEIVSDYLITDNFNPNKYISIASDSIGTLYDPPSAYSNATSGVKWSNPIYRGVINGAYYSTLGFLEIPLLFTCGGENFVGIRLYYDVVRTYIDKNNDWQVIDYGNSQELHEFHYTFVYMSYVYELSTSIGQAYTTWREKVVSAVPVYRIYNNYVDNNVEYRNYCYYLFEPYKWLSEDYKTISVYQASSEQLQRVGIDENISRSRFAINGLTIEQILQYDMRQEKDGVYTSSYIGNVFVVIKDAFASLMPLLSLTIIPGITIGMLMFLPLVLTIIIVVIKLVKR